MNNKDSEMKGEVDWVESLERPPLMVVGGASSTRSDAVQDFDHAMRKYRPQILQPYIILHLSFCLVGFLCTTMAGYDGSLLSSLLTNQHFRDYFHGSNTGIWVGIIASLYQIGSVSAIPFVGPAVDTWGRRKGIAIGVTLVVVGTVIQGATTTTQSVKQFMAGRFLLGFGAAIAQAGGPIYVIEFCHPVYRAVMTGLCNTFWFIGSIVATGAVRGSVKLGSNASWMLPVWLQLMCAVIILFVLPFLPESPRWLFVHGREEGARRVIAKYHGGGDPDNVWVILQLREYAEQLKLDGADKRWWDYRALFSKKSALRRLACNIIVQVFGQWTGNAVIGLTISAVLDSVGIRDQISQMNINLGLVCAQLAMAVTGAMFVEKLGRRPILIGVNISCAILWLGMTLATTAYEHSRNVAAAKAMLALIYLFGMVFSAGMTPMQVLYPIEVLSFEMRAKGVAFAGMICNAAGLLNTFAWPVALKAIGWKTYIILLMWCCVQALVIYLVIPETKDRTLEEMDEIFESSNPRKAAATHRTVPGNEI